MAVTLSGITIPVRLSHHENASTPIEVILSGITTLSNFSQKLNIPSLIDFTPEPMVAVVRLLQ